MLPLRRRFFWRENNCLVQLGDAVLAPAPKLVQPTLAAAAAAAAAQRLCTSGKYRSNRITVSRGSVQRGSGRENNHLIN
jgi:hypothetical protein